MNRFGVSFRAGLAVCAFVVTGRAGADEKLPAFTNVTGGTYTLPAAKDCKAVVLIFFGHDCPISNKYAPEIARLHKSYASRGIAFCIVYADADLKAADARKHAKEYGFPCPAILDPKMVLARKVGATVKPEAAVLSRRARCFTAVGSTTSTLTLASAVSSRPNAN